MCALSQNVSQQTRESSFAPSKQLLIEKILSRGDLPHVSMQDQCDLLHQLCTFELGRFLVENGALDGYWTQYVVHYPETKKPSNKALPPLETFLLTRAPTCLATQERFQIFKSQIQSFIKPGCHFASIPCGLMAELLDLDFSHIRDFTLTGIDLDPHSITYAKEYAVKQQLEQHCHFSVCNAWKLDIHTTFDLIASNGLNIYERDEEKVLLLYRKFYQALNPQGVLITSFLTPPPIPGQDSEWKKSEVNPQDALMQRILFSDILGAKWQAYRTQAQTKKLLKDAGFEKIDVIYDQAHIFPTVVATK